MRNKVFFEKKPGGKVIFYNKVYSVVICLVYGIKKAA